MPRFSGIVLRYRPGTRRVKFDKQTHAGDGPDCVAVFRYREPLW